MPMPKMNPTAPVAIIIPTRNRLAFTKLSFTALLKYTDFNLVRMVKVYDNYSEDGTFEYIKKLVFDITQGKFPNSNFCINEFSTLYRGIDIKYLIKIDNDRVLKRNWLKISLNFFKKNPNTGTLFICKRVGPYFPSYSNQHGGVFMTRYDLIKKFGSFNVCGLYPGCHIYNDFVVSQGFFRYAIPRLCIDVSHLAKYSDLVKSYGEKNYMRICG